MLAMALLLVQRSTWSEAKVYCDFIERSSDISSIQGKQIEHIKNKRKMSSGWLLIACKQHHLIFYVCELKTCVYVTLLREWSAGQYCGTLWRQELSHTFVFASLHLKMCALPRPFSSSFFVCTPCCPNRNKVYPKKKKIFLHKLLWKRFRCWSGCQWPWLVLSG